MPRTFARQKQAGRLASEHLLRTHSMSVRSKFSLSKELSKICTGRCPVLRGSDTERQGIQCVPNQNATHFECARIIRKDNQKQKGHRNWCPFVFGEQDNLQLETIKEHRQL